MAPRAFVYSLLLGCSLQSASAATFDVVLVASSSSREAHEMLGTAREVGFSSPSLARGASHWTCTLSPSLSPSTGKVPMHCAHVE